jgi:hypothetical protein
MVAIDVSTLIGGLPLSLTTSFNRSKPVDLVEVIELPLTLFANVIGALDPFIMVCVSCDYNAIRKHQLGEP